MSILHIFEKLLFKNCMGFARAYLLYISLASLAIYFQIQFFKYMQYIIKEKFSNFICSLACLIFITSCASNDIKQVTPQVTQISYTEIAILLPLTGPDADKSKEYISMMRAGLRDGSKAKIHLGIYDCATPEILNKSLEVISARGTDIIIGPIYSAPTQIVADQIRGKGIIAFSLSNNPALASEQVYIFGHAPIKQLQALINYSLHANYDHYITLMPEGEWSHKTNQIIAELIKTRGKKLSATEFYNLEDQESIKAAVNKLLAVIDNLSQNSSGKPAIILSDEKESMEKLLPILASHGIDKKAILMSDNRINFSPENRIDIIYPGSILFAQNNFLALASGFGIEKLSFMHLLSYDIGRIIGENIGNFYNRKEFVAQVDASNVFSAVSGDTYFAEHIAQRNYQIIKKEGGLYTILYPIESEQNLVTYENRR